MGWQLERPAAVVGGAGGEALPLEAHAHLLTCIGPTAQREGTIALQYHPIGIDGGQLQPPVVARDGAVDGAR